MRKAFIILAVMVLMVSSAWAETRQDNLNLDIVALESIHFNVIEETISITVIQGATGNATGDMSFEIGGGTAGTARVYAAAVSAEPNWATFLTNDGLSFAAQDHIGEMRTGYQSIRIGPVTNASTQLTNTGFTLPLVTSALVHGRIAVDQAVFFTTFGSTYSGTVNATVQFLAELL